MGCCTVDTGGALYTIGALTDCSTESARGITTPVFTGASWPVFTFKACWPVNSSRISWSCFSRPMQIRIKSAAFESSDLNRSVSALHCDSSFSNSPASWSTICVAKPCARSRKAMLFTLVVAAAIARSGPSAHPRTRNRQLCRSPPPGLVGRSRPRMQRPRRSWDVLHKQESRNTRYES